MRSLAIIPARSGSKGLINKNIRDLAGKPLIAYTIEAAIKSKCFSTVMLSTDSKKYAEIAIKYGADVPFLRSEVTSNDMASSWAVVNEVLEEYKRRGIEFDLFALLQPTTPLRNVDDIRNGFALMDEKDASAVVAVCEAEHSLSIYNTLPENHSFVGFLNNPSKYARQMDKKYYRLNGALYISTVKHFLSHEFIYDGNCYATIMPLERSIDIDSHMDFVIAQAMLSNYVF